MLADFLLVPAHFRPGHLAEPQRPAEALSLSLQEAVAILITIGAWVAA